MGTRCVCGLHSGRDECRDAPALDGMFAINGLLEHLRMTEDTRKKLLLASVIQLPPRGPVREEGLLDPLTDQDILDYLSTST